MQRRLVEELKELESNIQSIKDYHEKNQEGWDIINQQGKTIKNMHAIEKYAKNIRWILLSLLSAPDKAFEVVFKNKDYNFIYPSTSAEELQMDLLREELIINIVSHCIVEMSCGNDTWWMVTAFASGIDTLDMQIEIVKEDFTNRVDDNGEKITALPLDMENYQINLQRPEIEDVFKDQALDL